MSSETKPAQADRLPLGIARLISILMAYCFGLVGAAFVQWLFPGRDDRGLAVLVLLAAGEAALTAWFLRQRKSGAAANLGYRIAEWVLLLVVVKAFTELHGGFAGLWDNLRSWGQDFPRYIFTRDFVLNALVAYAAWQACSLFMKTLLDMEETYQNLNGEAPPAAPEQRQPFRDQLLRNLLLVGGLMVLFGGTALQTSVLPAGGGPAQAQVGWFIVVFFLLGLVLVGLTNFTALITFWRFNRVAVQANVAGRWTLLSLAFLALLVGASVWLPTNYELGLFDTLRVVFGFLFAIIQFFYFMILLFFSAISRTVARLFDLPETSQAPVQPPVTPPDLLQEAAAARQVSEPDLLRSLFFWAVFLGILLFAFRQYLAANPELRAALKRIGPLRWMATLWNWFKSAFVQAGEGVGNLVRRGVNRLRAAGQARRDLGTRNYLNLRRLPPRQKVLFYYLALVRRGGETGLTRADWQTPREYAATLESRLEAEEENVEEMTADFMEARYSRQEISGEQAGRAQTAWERLRRALREARKGTTDEKG